MRRQWLIVLAAVAAVIAVAATLFATGTLQYPLGKDKADTTSASPNRQTSPEVGRSENRNAVKKKAKAKPTRAMIVASRHLNIRSKPTTRHNKPLGLLSRGKHVAVVKTVKSQDPYHDGRNKWSLTSSGKWLWAGGLTTPKAAKAAAKVHHVAHKARSKVVRRPVAHDSGGSPQAIARRLLAARGWSSQFSCLNSLINRESGWRVNATNPSSGAYGIPQALPAGKMASAGANWRTSATTQLVWMMGYIKARYHTPCGAWGHSQATGWY